MDSSLVRANMQLGAGKIDSAKSLFAVVRDEERDDLRALVGLGRVALAEQNWREALDLAKDGLEIDTASIWCHYLAAIAEREIGTSLSWRNSHWKTSRMHIDRILERDSSFEDVLYQYAKLERYDGYRDHALELARVQIARKPDLPGSHLGLYKLYRYYMAVQDSAEFLGWVRNQPGALPRYFIGETLRRSGNLAGAESLFAELLHNPAEISPQALRLARARLRFKQGEKQAAEAEYWRGVQELKTELGAAILFEDLKYVVSDAELEYYRGLDSLRARQDFFRSFWNFRNPSLALKTNLRLQEHIRRCLVAEEQYEYCGFRTWFNNPDKLHALSFPKASALNEEFNDMGLIYLRQGAPDDIVRYGFGMFDWDFEELRLNNHLRTKAMTLEEDKMVEQEQRDRHRRADKGDYQSWLYDATAESPKMIFHFQKNSAGNIWRLTGLPDHDLMLDRLALWDPRFQELSETGLGTRAILETRVTAESKALVDYALSTDKQTWDRKISTFRFPHAIDVFRAPDGRSLLDISYAIPTATLARLLPDTAHTVPVEIGFFLIDSKSHKAASQLDTINVDLSHTRTGAIVNLIRYTVPPDSYQVSMRIRPLSGDLLGNWKQTVRASDFSRPGFMMSSIQFLRPSPEKGSLEIDGVKVVQSPFRTHVRTEPLYVYFQIYNLIPDGDGNTSYATECRLMSPGEDDWDKGIVIHRKQKTGKEEMGVEFYTIDVRSVSSGRYTLMMRVTDRKRVETIAGVRDIEILKP
jgi:hypothetical protein